MYSPRSFVLPLVAALASACGASAPPPPEPAPISVEVAGEPPPPPAPAEVAAEEPPAPEPAPAPESPPATPSPWLAGPTNPGPGAFVLDGGRLVVKEPIEFELAKETLAPSSGPAVDYVTAFLQAKPDITLLRVEGHSDNRGSGAANLALSGQRAFSFARALVARGVDCRRLLPVGFGETKPVADNRTEEGRKQNRRMEFVVAALRGRPVGGMPVDGGGRIAGDPCR
ncbi:OmpA family protein [Polyangium spumosum]|uniref:OmpA family protein n=1 Tax=Polyangium spumosum TaxID=889282 RepID=A0A6N7PMS0_9BACT|nr:OmpA family protein [Polyangium spumosum]